MLIKPRRQIILYLTVWISILAAGIEAEAAPRPGTSAPRRGDEIVAAGQFFHTGTRVVLWLDPGGYDAYRVERRFSPIESSGWEASQEEAKELNTPNRFNLRTNGLTAEEIERVRGGGWDLPLLQRVVDQFVIHFDVAGTSRQCFKILHDQRDLSVHFMLDLDGTIYQTLDLKERAWHATSSNSRSVGIEIANVGAYGATEKNPFAEWYTVGTNGETFITIPARYGDGGIRTECFQGHPKRQQPIIGTVQGRELIQYDFTSEQYKALSKLTATLIKVFPKIRCDYPRDSEGKLITQKLPDETLKTYSGLLGHYHIQSEKIDPGPAFQWDYVVRRARAFLIGGMSEAADETSKGHMRPRQ
jgi:N-acetyl-anhydromuramyl-L-alanine amidase AmpD